MESKCGPKAIIKSFIVKEAHKVNPNLCEIMVFVRQHLNSCKKSLFLFQF